MLDAIPDPPSLKRRSSNVQTVPIPADRAAAMFHMNLGVWRHNDFVRRTVGPSDLDDLERNLAAIACGRTAVGPVEWGLRHIVLDRIDP